MTPATSFNLPGVGKSVKIPAVAAAQKIEMYQCIETKFEEDRSSGSLLEVEEGNDSDLILEEAVSTPKAIMRKSSGLQGKVMPESFGQGMDGHVSHGAWSPLNVMKHKTSHKPISTSKKTKTTSTYYRYRMDWADVWYNSREFKGTPQAIQST